MTLNHVADRFSAGEESAFSEIAKELTEPLTNFAKQRTRGSLAEDCVQETLIVIFANLRKGVWSSESGGTLKSYAFAILRNQIKWAIRNRISENAKKAVIRESYNPSENYCEELSEVAKLLDDEEMFIFRMIADGKTLSEIANVLNTKPVALQVRVHRIRQRIS